MNRISAMSLYFKQPIFKIAILFLFIFLCLDLSSQTFSVSPKVELEKWQSTESYSFYDRFQSANKTIVPMRLQFSEKTEDTVLLLIIDSALNDSKLYFIRPTGRLSVYEDYYLGAEMPDGEILVMSQFYIYRTKKTGQVLVEDKRIRLKDDCNFISSLDGKIGGNRVLLADTYNDTRKGRPYDIISLKVFNMKTRLVERSANLDIGNGILMSHIRLDMVANSNDYVAVSSPLLGEVYVMNNKLKVIDTIVVDYPPIRRTKQLLDSILPDKVLLENYPNAHLNLRIMNKHSFHLRPKINKIAFVGNDLLYIEVPVEEDSYSGRHIDFVYSIPLKKFLNDSGKINNNKEILLSQPLIFNGSNTITISDSLGNDGIYHYYYKVTTISDYNPSVAPILDRTKYPPISSLETIFDTSGIQYDYKDFDYIMFADVGSCSHCRYGSMYGKIMVIHVEENLGALSLSNKNLHKKKYELMFNFPKVFFVEKKILDPCIKINCIYKIDK